MSQLNNCINKNNYVFVVKDNLEEFTSRLKEGMVLKGKIIRCLGDNKYLLRIWGYNMLTESCFSFNELDKISVAVKEIKPRLIFSLLEEEELFKKRSNYKLSGDIDILVW